VTIQAGQIESWTGSLGLAACSDVSVAYRSGEQTVMALDAVDFAVAPGDRVGLTGRSGSGKTTLLHVLGGLVEPTSGRVFWHDRELSSLDAAARGRARAQGIAYVFQGANLLPHFTAFENVAFALDTSASPTCSDRLGVSQLLELVGLGSKLDSLPSELSGGESQRVAIARALGQHPELLLCDEPSGHLDSDTGARVLDLVDALQERLGFALVVATHDARVASHYERTVHLADGKIDSQEDSR
jgi:putative ABC transport system ATP-binding protein